MQTLQEIPSTDAISGSTPNPGGLLDELEQRQNDVLTRLDALDAQVEALLASWSGRVEESGDGIPQDGQAE